MATWRISIQWLEAQCNMTEQEWLELLELEAPSILGVCHPAASVLDVSEPSFCWESSESDSCEMDLSPVASQADDSLRGYSPSPLRSPVDDIGFNLEVNLEAIPEPAPHPSEAENFAVGMLRQQWAAESSLLRLMELLPTTMRSFQADGDQVSEVNSGAFSTGAYVYSSQVGLMLHVRQFRAVTHLLASLVRSLNPDHYYSSVSMLLNTRSAPHRDSNNHPSSVNMVVPLSNFKCGQIWVEIGGGDVEVNGVKGRLTEVTRPFVTFQPKQLHCTMPWEGNGLILVAYHIRSAHLLTMDDRLLLAAMGFRLILER